MIDFPSADPMPLALEMPALSKFPRLPLLFQLTLT